MSIIKPNKLLTYSEKDNPRILKIVAEPLERGFGLTLGNSLRRVLLSSIQGAAVTFIKIAGVTHEFQSLHGVKEDVTDIILNIKTMVLKMTSSERKTLTLKATGPCTVTAKMIALTTGVEVVNPDHLICTLETNASLDLEMICEIGRGYLPATAVAEKANQDSFGKMNTSSQLEYIAIDALFSPVKSVLYKVENTRVGQVTDYDKLIMTIETNGAIAPADAISLATKILQEQFNLFLIGDAQEYKVDLKKTKELDMKFHPVLLRLISTFDLSVRCGNCLRGDNVTYVGDLVQKTESELLKLPNFGKKSLEEIYLLLDNLNREFFIEKENRNKVQSKNSPNNVVYQQFSALSLGMKLPDWNKEAIENLVKKYDNLTC